jgi:hypothetical protein
MTRHEYLVELLKNDPIISTKESAHGIIQAVCKKVPDATNEEIIAAMATVRDEAAATVARLEQARAKYLEENPTAPRLEREKAAGL